MRTSGIGGARLWNLNKSHGRSADPIPCCGELPCSDGSRKAMRDHKPPRSPGCAAGGRAQVLLDSVVRVTGLESSVRPEHGLGAV